MTQTASLIIGIDGGGTSCRASLVVGPGGTRHDVVLGPANVSTDFGAALRTINDAIANLCAQSGVTPDALAGASAHLGLAGVMNPGIASRVVAALPMRSAVVTDDRPTTIAGALGEADGAVAAIGTGSFIGRQANGQISGVGGWGFYIGDQASGAWLFRRCLEEVMLVVDGLAPATDLTAKILADHQGDPGQIVLFSLASQPADYARLARDVVAAAENGDPLGARLLQEGAGYIRAALRVVGWTETEPLCLTGGLGAAYARWLGIDAMPPRGTALEGALALAARQKVVAS